MSDTEIAYLASGNVIPIPTPGTPLELTAFAVSGSSLNLTWNGGQPRYQVQRRTQWGMGSWENVGGTTDVTTATVGMTGEAAYFRVLDGQ